MLKFFNDESCEEIQPFAEQLLELGQKVYVLKYLVIYKTYFNNICFILQYKIAELKSKCEDILKQNISFDSVVKFLKLAEKNQAQILKTKCIEYIRLVLILKINLFTLTFNFRECPRIQTTEQYFSLMDDDPSLMVHFVNLE